MLGVALEARDLETHGYTERAICGRGQPPRS